MRWFFPSMNGDFRLEVDPTSAKSSVLHVNDATIVEQEQLHAFLKVAEEKKWIDKKIVKGFDPVFCKLPLKGSVAEAGKELLKHCRPKKAVLTAVKFAGGKLVATDDTGGELGESAIDAIVNEPDAQAAVSVKRPTPSCPDCQPGAVSMASEVLQAFLTPDEHESWAKHRQLVVTGGLSGHRYLLSHRHHPRAVKDQRMCFDLDGGYVVKFFDWGVPPEEEVLAAKLILEHQEPWLRNEATLWHMMEEYRAEPIFKNPFGAYDDGVSDAAFFQGIGAYFEAVGLRQPIRVRPRQIMVNGSLVGIIHHDGRVEPV